jgi:signal transduction histidine kinase
MAFAVPKQRSFAIVSAIAAVGLAVATFVTAPATLRGMLSSNFLPHRYCYLYDEKLIAFHIGTDTAIFLSYVAISCTLVYLVWRTRREIPFSWMVLAFGLFIISCGFTHLMEVIVLWKPLYWLSGDVKFVTAIASVVTAVALPGLVPQIHDMVRSAQTSDSHREQLEQANSQLQEISSQVMGVQDDERRRIARELHDSLGQYLVGAKMSIDRGLAGDSAALRDATTLLDNCISEVRTLSHLLHPPLLEEVGLMAAIPWYVTGFRERSGIDASLEIPENFARLPQRIELALFRVLQESLTNIHRHSNAKNALVKLALTDGHATLTVKDFGTGFATERLRRGKQGVGIASMRERMRELGGELRIKSTPTGTTIQATLPTKEVAQRSTGQTPPPRSIASKPR